MRRYNKVFVATDAIHSRLLDEVTRELVARGVEVTRGPGDPSLVTPATLAHYIGDAEVAAVTIRQPVGRDHLERLPRLIGLCHPVTGVESVDLEAATDLGVLVAHGATRLNSVGMAEATIMLALALLYQMPAAQRLMSGGEKPVPPQGRLAHGKTFGLLGFGRIAAAVAERLQGFGVRLMTHSPTTDPQRVPAYVRRVNLDTLMRESDVLFVMATLTPRTLGIIGRRELALMKTSAFLVNTARGALIEEDALVAALADGRLAGAALDTFTVEPLSVDSPLRHLSNVILTPHMVGHTIEGHSEFAAVMVENITRLLAAEMPTYCKNPRALDRWRGLVPAPRPAVD